MESLRFTIGKKIAAVRRTLFEKGFVKTVVSRVVAVLYKVTCVFVHECNGGKPCFSGCTIRPKVAKQDSEIYENSKPFEKQMSESTTVNRISKTSLTLFITTDGPYLP